MNMYMSRHMSVVRTLVVVVMVKYLGFYVMKIVVNRTSYIHTY